MVACLQSIAFWGRFRKGGIELQLDCFQFADHTLVWPAESDPKLKIVPLVLQPTGTTSVCKSSGAVPGGRGWGDTDLPGPGSSEGLLGIALSH